MSQSTLSTTPSRHFRLRMAAVLYFGARLLLVALLVAAPLAYWRMGITDWRMGAGAAGVVLLAFIFAWLTALPVRCVVCTQPTLSGSSQPKHPYAAKWLGLSYPARVAWDVLTAEYHQCMYCHSRCRNRGPSRHRVGKAGSVKSPELRPDLATLMGPGAVVAVETPKVEAVAPIFAPSSLGAEPVVEPVALPVLAAPSSLPVVLSPDSKPLIAGLSSQADSREPASVPLLTSLPLLPVLEPTEPQSTSLVPPAISPVAAPVIAFPVFDSSPTPAPVMSAPASPLTVPAFPFQNALSGPPEVGLPSEVPSPAAASAPAVVSPPPLLPVSSVNQPPAPSNPFAMPPPAESSVPDKAPTSFFGAVRPPALPVGPSPFLAPEPPQAATPVPPVLAGPPPLEPTWSAPAPPPLPIAALPVFPQETAMVEQPVMSGAQAPLPFIPAASLAAPGLPLEVVIKVLQEGRASMELAFQSMIDQLRASLEGGASPSGSGVDLPEAAASPLPGQPAPAMPEVLPLPTQPVAAPPLLPVWPEAVAPAAPAPAPNVAAVPAFPNYPPLYPVAPPLPQVAPPTAGGFTEPPASGGITATVRRRPLPAISPSLIAELDSTLAQAFSPASAPEAGNAPAPASAPLPPALPLPAGAEVPSAFSLTPLSVPPGNSFAPTPPAFGPDSTDSPPEDRDEGAPAVPAPFSFLQAVPVPVPWPNDDLPDLAPAETPPMWTRTRGNPSLS